MTLTDSFISSAGLKQWEDDGYVVARGLFEAKEVAAIRERFDQLAKGDPVPGHWEPADNVKDPDDPLFRYPRVMHPHRFCELSKRTLLSPKVAAVLRHLLGSEPIATQTMYYFKPPGSRGQAFHQDNFYLEVRPSTCFAAWLAVDPAMPENGGLWVSPGSHKLDVICPDIADENQSFTTHLVEPPEGMEAVPTYLEPGDVLFFNGSLIHGSKPNEHPTLWRRSFISHYMPEVATHISDHYFPLLDFEGNEVHRERSAGGGPCGNDPKPVSHGRWATS